MAKVRILNELIEVLGVTISAFEKSCGIGNGTLSKAIEKNKDLTTASIAKIIAKYPHISKGWLYTGEGDMFTEPQNTINQAKEQALKIATGNPSIKVEDLLNDENDKSNKKTNENIDNQADTEKNNSDINKELVNLEFTKSDQAMLQDFIAIYRKDSDTINAQVKLADKIADAMTILAENNSRLANIIEKMTGVEAEGSESKRKAG